MKKNHNKRLRKPFRIVLDAIIIITLFVGMLYIFAGAVLQESYRNYLPTDAEIAEDPSLVIYWQGAGQ